VEAEGLGGDQRREQTRRTSSRSAAARPARIGRPMARRRPRIVVQASGWPGYRPGHRQLPAGRAPAGRRAARRRARGQGRAGRRAGGRPGRPGRDGVAVGEPQNAGQRQAVQQHQAGRRPALKLRSFAGGEAAEQGGPGASGLPFLLFVLARPPRSGRAAAPAGPPGRSPRLRCNPAKPPGNLPALARPRPRRPASRLRTRRGSSWCVFARQREGQPSPRPWPGGKCRRLPSTRCRTSFR